MVSKKIDFGIIGFPKCGTSSLYHNLNSHPNINMIPGENVISDLFKTLSSITPNNDQIVGFKTADLVLDSDNIIQLINHNPNLKMIVSMRDPASFLFSFYQYRKLEISENRKWLQPALEKNPHFKDITFDQVVYEDRKFLGVDMEKGEFIHYLKNLISLVPPEQILITFLENIQNYPKKEYNRILDFLNLQPNQIDLENLGVFNSNKEKYEAKEKYEDHFKKLYEYYLDSMHELDIFLRNTFNMTVPNSIKKYYKLN